MRVSVVFVKLEREGLGDRVGFRDLLELFGGVYLLAFGTSLGWKVSIVEERTMQHHSILFMCIMELDTFFKFM